MTEPTAIERIRLNLDMAFSFSSAQAIHARLVHIRNQVEEVDKEMRELSAECVRLSALVESKR